MKNWHVVAAGPFQPFQTFEVPTSASCVTIGQKGAGQVYSNPRILHFFQITNILPVFFSNVIFEGYKKNKQRQSPQKIAKMAWSLGRIVAQLKKDKVFVGELTIHSTIAAQFQKENAKWTGPQTRLSLKSCFRFSSSRTPFQQKKERIRLDRQKIPYKTLSKKG